MRARFVAQPFSTGYDLRDFIESVAADTSLTTLYMVVAWAKRSGFRVVEEALTTLRRRGGSITLILGISEGGATRQGLEMARQLCDTVYVMHHPGGRTFHPKLYLAEGVTRAMALVGSHNMTRGGAVENFEAGIICDLNLSDAADAGFLSAFHDYLKLLRTDTNICRRLDQEVLHELVSNPGYLVGDEDEQRGSTPRQNDSDSRGELSGNSTFWLFGRSRHTLRRAPSSPQHRPSRGANRILQPSVTPTGPPSVIHRWFVRLTPAGAQRPRKATTHPTGYLTLGKARHPINAETYFRTEFFAAAKWSPRGARRERATVSFDVSIRGQRLGKRDLVVDYAPDFESAQGNRVNLLRWGDDLNQRLHATNYVGDYVTLEQLSDHSYRLLIDAAPAGPFIR